MVKKRAAAGGAAVPKKRRKKTQADEEVISSDEQTADASPLNQADPTTDDKSEPHKPEDVAEGANLEERTAENDHAGGEAGHGDKPEERTKNDLHLNSKKPPSDGKKPCYSFVPRHCSFF